MRPIKFRAWNGEEMTREFFITSNGEISYGTVIGHNGNQVFNIVDWKLMEWTGLLDKNGKEIYEGSVVKSTISNNDDSTKLVEWDGFRFLPFTGTCSCCEDYEGWRGDDCEVIGDIYSNPEILK